MTDNLQARLDRAITEARASMSIAYQLLATCEMGEAPDRKAQADRWTDTFAALVALRARTIAHGDFHDHSALGGAQEGGRMTDEHEHAWQAWRERYDAERTRADAAEAQRDRLTAALRDADAVMRDADTRDPAYWAEVNAWHERHRAALADVPKREDA